MTRTPRLAALVLLLTLPLLAPAQQPAHDITTVEDILSTLPPNLLAPGQGWSELDVQEANELLAKGVQGKKLQTTVSVFAIEARPGGIHLRVTPFHKTSLPLHPPVKWRGQNVNVVVQIPDNHIILPEDARPWLQSVKKGDRLPVIVTVAGVRLTARQQVIVQAQKGPGNFSLPAK